LHRKRPPSKLDHSLHFGNLAGQNSSPKEVRRVIYNTKQSGEHLL
jgi:hypothetical protein